MTTAQDVPGPAEQVVARSRRLGSDPTVTNYAGGNTSAKGAAPDPVTGRDVDLLWVKGSGGDLGTLTPAGLAVLRLDRLRALTAVYPGVDREDEMVAAFDFCRHGTQTTRSPKHSLVSASPSAAVARAMPASGCRWSTCGASTSACIAVSMLGAAPPRPCRQ